MLIKEKIKVKACSKNIKYYESKGYCLPKKQNGRYDLKKEFEIWNFDIAQTSRIKVRCLCDDCNTELHVQAGNRNFLSNKDYCVRCGHKKAPITKIKK